MIEEAIAKIEELAVAAKETQILTLPGSGKKALIVKGDGTVAEYAIDSIPIRARFDTISSLRTFISHHCDVRSDWAVFVDRSRVQFVFDLNDRRERAYLPLNLTTLFNYLDSIVAGSGTSLNAKELIRFLRVTCDGCVDPSSNLIQLLRNLKWSTSSSANQVVTHGRESLGRHVEASVSSEASLPDEFTLDVSVFDCLRLPQRIRIALDPDPETQRFRLEPFPGSLERAMEETLTHIASEFASEDMPNVYMGDVDGD